MSLVYAPVVEQVDTRDLKSLGSDTVPVRVRSGAPLTLNERTDSNAEVDYLLTIQKEVRKMSRSYKHTPRAGDTKDKFFKKYANRRVRRLPIDEHPLNHKTYKKATCSWNICDYETVGTSFEQYWEGLVKSWHRWKSECGLPYPNRDEAYQEYRRWFLRK